MPRSDCPFNCQPVVDGTATTTGNLNAVITVQVGSQVPGNIKALYADFNTKVKKGQLVALIDPAPFQAAADQAKATLNSAKAAALTAQASLAKSQSDVASALANVVDQKANAVKAQSAADLAKVEADRELALLHVVTDPANGYVYIAESHRDVTDPNLVGRISVFDNNGKFLR